MKLQLLIWCAALLMSASFVAADEYEAVKLDEAPPADELSPAMVSALETTGWKVRSGPDRTVCDVWLVKQWPANGAFEPTPSVLYPFQPGQLMGVIRFKRRANDFRGQEIGKGVYTLRYSLQPEDGNHIGTSDTRDFIAMSKAADDQDPAPMAIDKLMPLSAQAAETTHPAILSLVSNAGLVPEAAKIVRDEPRDWTILVVSNPAADGDKTWQQALGIVVVGHSAE